MEIPISISNLSVFPSLNRPTITTDTKKFSQGLYGASALSSRTRPVFSSGRVSMMKHTKYSQLLKVMAQLFPPQALKHNSTSSKTFWTENT